MVVPRLIEGDCLAVMAEMPPDSIDACVTDPPYGLEFMSVAWDTFGDGRKGGERVPNTWGDHGSREHPRNAYQQGHIRAKKNRAFGEFSTAWAEAVYRVLKPGAHLVAFGGTRTYHRLTCAIEDAGFDIRDCLMWLYGSGFPKGKGCLKPGWEPIVLARKPGPSPWLNVDGCRIDAGSRPARLNLGGYKQTNAYGTGKHGSRAIGETTDGRWPANVVLDEWSEQVLYLKYNIPDEVRCLIREYFDDYRRVPQLSGSDQNLPEQEGSDEILRASLLCDVDEREPDGAESTQVSALPLGRVEGQDGRDSEGSQGNGRTECGLEGRTAHLARLRHDRAEYARSGRAGAVRVNGDTEQQSLHSGASPSHGSDDRSSVDPIRSGSSLERSQVGQSPRESSDTRRRGSQARALAGTQDATGAPSRKRPVEVRALEVLRCDVPAGWLGYFADTGKVVRSPDCAAELLDAQSGHLKGRGNVGPTRQGKEGTNAYGNFWRGLGDAGHWHDKDGGGASRFYYVAKASPSERGAFNDHPTVKPLALMRWLVRLVTPVGETVLDPFCGSGSTLLAAQAESFECVGIDADPHAIEITRRRLTDAAGPLFAEEAVS